MRQPQQKSRSRGRGRKPQNPLSRNFESNGPDVKIRGNANHIAEKYTTLARDALSNGDTVMAENYFQHAEHYNRIVAAAQSQQQQQQQQQQAGRNEDAQAANGKGPQPQVDNVPDNGEPGSAEKTPVAQPVAQEVSSAPADAQKGDAPGEKRARRPRKSDNTAEAVEAEPASEVQPSADAESISDDAAKLPESITGSLVAE